jgi:hypothetical protein
MICRPPTPSTMLLRKRTPAVRSSSTVAATSSSSIAKRFQPPGVGIVPSGIGAPPPGPPPGALRMSRRSPLVSIANVGAGRISSVNPSRSR